MVQQNTSDLLLHYNSKIAILLLPNSIYLLIGCFFAVIGNILVMHIHWRKLNASQNFRMFIPFLALCDCIGSVVCSCVSVIQNFSWMTWSNPVTCKIAWVGVRFFQATSGVLLVAIAFQRFVRICRPFKKTPSRYRIFIYALCGVIFVIFETVPFVVFANTVKHPHNQTNNSFVYFECKQYETHDSESIIYYKIIEYTLQGLGVIGLVLMYLKSGMRLSNTAKRVNKTKGRPLQIAENFKNEIYDESSVTAGRSFFYTVPSESNNLPSDEASISAMNYGTTNRALKRMRSRNQKYIRINCMFIVISLIVILSYIPRLVISFLEVDKPDFWMYLPDSENFQNDKLLAMIWINRLYMVPFFVNPLIYSIMDIEFRKYLTRCFCSCPESR